MNSPLQGQDARRQQHAAPLQGKDAAFGLGALTRRPYTTARRRKKSAGLRRRCGRVHGFGVFGGELLVLRLLLG